MKHTNKKLLNQNGASAIMFSLFFIMVISLITIGFATLARRDQRATLDKTLSAQAQLAAESGVNAAKTYLLNTSPPASNNNCDASGVLGSQMPRFSDGVKITCLKWNTTPTEAVFTLQPFEPYSFNQKNHQGFTSVEWSTANAPIVAGNYSFPGSNKLPSISGSKKSILKIVTVNRTDIYDVSPKKVQVFYLVPYDGNDVIPNTVTPATADLGNDYVDLGNAGVGTLSTEPANGLVYYVPCPTEKCKVTIAGYSFANNLAGYGDRLFSFMPMGSDSTTITYRSLSGYNGVPAALDNIQASIDVNAIAQDQSKRLISYVPIDTKYTWQPFFSVIAENLCKDLKVDGNNTSGINEPANTCPNL